MVDVIDSNSHSRLADVAEHLGSNAVVNPAQDGSVATLVTEGRSGMANNTVTVVVPGAEARILPNLELTRHWFALCATDTPTARLIRWDRFLSSVNRQGQKIAGHQAC